MSAITTPSHDLVGQSVRYTFDHLFDKVTCKCRILSVDEDKASFAHGSPSRL